MDKKTVLGLASILICAGALAYQDPSFEYPGVKPVLTSGCQVSAAAEPIFQKKVTVRFENADLDTILDWLSNQGISFVTTGLDKDKSVNLNLSNVPLGQAIDAIGQALGGHWNRHGNVFSFEKGGWVTFGGTVSAGGSGMIIDPGTMPKASVMDISPWMDPSDQQDPKKFEELQKQMQKQFGPDSDFMKQIQKQWGENGEMRKQMQKQFGPDSEFMKQFKNFKWSNKDFQGFKNFKWDGKDDFKWNEFSREIQKSLGPDSEFQKQFKNFKWSDKDMKSFMDMKDFKWDSKDMKGFKDFKWDPKDMKGFENFSKEWKEDGLMQGQDLKGIAKSLTSAQREKNKQQGFLYYSDLTPDQKRKLGMKATGNWSITYSEDGESFTVKSDPK